MVAHFEVVQSATGQEEVDPIRLAAGGWARGGGVTGKGLPGQLRVPWQSWRAPTTRRRKPRRCPATDSAVSRAMQLTHRGVYTDVLLKSRAADGLPEDSAGDDVRLPAVTVAVGPVVTFFGGGAVGLLRRSHRALRVAS